MKITKLHAFFKIADDSYNSQRVGFSCDIDENENIEEAVNILRTKALSAMGKSNSELYQTKRIRTEEVKALEIKLEKYRKEWDLMAEFLRAQGIKPDASSMPQFQNLLTGTPDVEYIAVEDVDDNDYEEYEQEEDDEDDY